MRHFSFGFLRARAYGSEREGNFGLNYSMSSRVYVIKKKKEEERRDCKRFKVWKLNLKPFFMMVEFGKNPNFV